LDEDPLEGKGEVGKTSFKIYKEGGRGFKHKKKVLTIGGRKDLGEEPGTSRSGVR